MARASAVSHATKNACLLSRLSRVLAERRLNNCKKNLELAVLFSVIPLSVTSTTARKTSSTLGDGRLRTSSSSWRILVRVPHPHPLNRSGKMYQVALTI